MPGNLSDPIINDPALPLVSIVTPSYNQGQFIRATIESVLSQDYPNIEYWVIDGGSSDDTVNILREYEHDLRLHWLSEPDRGQSDAINKGLARCRGKIFSWLNSDDLLTSNALRHVVSAWSAEQPAIIYGLARFIDQSGKNLGYCPGQSSKVTLQKLLRFESYGMAQPATFAPTDYVRKLQGVDISLHYMMDLDLWIRLAKQLPIRFIPFDLALYRLHVFSKTTSQANKFIDDVMRISERTVEMGLLSKKQARSRAGLFAAMIYFTSSSNKNLGMALRNLGIAVIKDPSTLPDAAFMLLKGLSRLAVGNENWSRARRLRPKPL